MAIIDPVKKDVSHSSQIKKFSAPLRLWHWLNVIVISGSLITVLINSTVTDGHSTGKLIKSELKDAGATVTDDQARSVAHALSDSVWDIHIYFGYALTALLVFRLLLEFFQLADQKFIGVLKTAYRHFKQTKKQRETARHELAVKIIYSLFYLLLFVMVIT